MICEHNASFLHFEGKMLVIKSQCEEEKDKMQQKVFCKFKTKIPKYLLDFFCDSIAQEKNESILTKKVKKNCWDCYSVFTFCFVIVKSFFFTFPGCYCWRKGLVMNK